MIPPAPPGVTKNATSPGVTSNVMPALSGELEALLAAIAGAIDALVAWDITAFDSAIERQRRICERLASIPCAPAAGSARLSPAAAATARKVRELNRVYDRLLQHSVHWTRTMHSILEAGGHSFSSRASVHFRG